jgi:dihydroorotate dehydrogenase B-like protein
MIARAIHSNLTFIDSPRADLSANPGQFFLIVPPSFDPYLPQVVFPFRIRGGLVESFIVPIAAQAWAQQGGLKIRGAYGNGFTLPAKSSRTLVLANSAAAGGLLVPLIDSLLARDCEVAALCKPDALLESWLPPEVEFHVGDDILAAASHLWSWADAVYASGESDFYDQMLTAAKNERLRLKSGWGQILLYDLATPCGIGVCYLCALKTRRGPVLNCRDGPVYDLADWVVEG